MQLKLMKIIQLQTYNGGFWFRLFGYGFSVVNRHKHAALFSERLGYIKVLRLGRYSIKSLLP